jgi:limonene-1,2-epoxide hydrolase
VSTPEQLVNEFLAMWAKPGGFARAIEAMFTDTTVYENVGMTKSTGIAEAAAFATAFTESDGNATIKVDVLASAACGNTVMNERIDHVIQGDGTVKMSIAVMGIFEVEGGKITGWRDYFDTAGMFRQMEAQNQGS